MDDVEVYQLVTRHFANALPGACLHDKLVSLFSQLLGEVDIEDIISTVVCDFSNLVVAEIGRNDKALGIEFGEIVGAATLIVMLTPHGRVGYVHDVIVDEKYRGKGIGRKLMQEIIQIAQDNSLKEINLTTNAPKRPNAEALYLSLGFCKKPTGFYVLTI